MKCYKFFSIAVFVVSFASLAQGQLAPKPVDVIFTTIDVPGASYTILWGVNNNGSMLGSYGQDTAQDAHGFTLTSGTLTSFDYPGQDFTVPTGINDSNLIVGYAGQNSAVGFLYDGTSFTTIKAPNRSATYTNGINNAGYIVGGAGTPGDTIGFELRNGRFKTLPVPGSYVYVYGSGINSFGTVAGWTDGVTTDSFLCPSVSKCRIIRYPGAVRTRVFGINDAGIVVGWYGVSGGCGCAFAAKNGKFLSFSYPGAAFTGATGINNAGQIVGSYTFDYVGWHGFVTNPITDADFQ